MTQNKILTGLGATLIVVMLVIAAFALGVYVGEHGWTRDGLVLTGPRPQPWPGPAPDRPANPPLGAGQPLPGGRPNLVGRVQRTFDNRLQLATPNGPRTVWLTRDTHIEDGQGGAAGPESLRRGQDVAIFGQVDGDGRALVVNLIVLLPPPDQRPPPQQP